jgi:hypothetical protein
MKWILVGKALLFVAALQPSLAVAADKIIENVFASVTLDGKKIGQIHFTLTSKPTGEIEELRTDASVSILGVKLYSFSQHLHETWRNGSLQTLRSDADDNGTDERVRVKRTGDDFDAERNNEPVDLPGTVFPDSIWHYAVTKEQRLFNSVDLKIMNVSVSRKAETIDYLGKPTPAERFDFSGDWHATLWFGNDKRLLKAHRMIGGREIIITIDSD